MAWHPWVRSDKYPDVWTAVYRLYDANKRLLYVGIGYDYLARWQQHAKKRWWRDVVSKDVIWFDNRLDAAFEEARAIRNESPVHNIRPGISFLGMIVISQKDRYGVWRQPARPQMVVSTFDVDDTIRNVQWNRAHAAVVNEGEIDKVYVPWEWYERARVAVDGPLPKLVDLDGQPVDF